MTIIGFNFTKINAAKHGPVKGKVTINRRCVPTKVEEAKMGGSGQKALKYSFEFEAEYKPKMAEILFEGTLTELLPEKDAEKVLAAWNKNNKLGPEQIESVMNAILNRCHIEALMMSKELGIPPPLNLPRIQVKEKEAPAKK